MTAQAGGGAWRRLQRCVNVGLGAMLVLLTLPGAAHQSGTSYLTLESGTASLAVQIDFPVKDLSNLLQSPTEHTPDHVRADAAEFTSARLAQIQPQLESIVTRKLVVEADARALPLTFVAQSVRLRSDGLYVRQSYVAPPLRAQDAQLVVRYQFFTPAQTLARAHARLVLDGREHSAVFDPGTPVQRFAVRESTRWQTMRQFLREGALHIWGGPDHLLFLLCLLLPALRLVGTAPAASRWRNARPAVVFTLKVVTAFTIAHSLTLAAAALGWVELPEVLVESVIAASIMAAAALNLSHRPQRDHALLAFGFGLIHGLGFANGLRELGLTHGHFLESLLAFNAGVEFGQLATVLALAVLLLPWLDRDWVRLRLARWGSLLVLPVAGIWLAQRLTG